MSNEKGMISKHIYDIKVKEMSDLLEEKNQAIQGLLGQVNRLSDELDYYEDLIIPFRMFSKEGLEVVGDALQKGNEMKLTNEEIVTYALGEFLKQLASK